MAIEQARLCGSCERECPSWADRCPACGHMSMFRRIVVIPSAVVAPQRAEPVPLPTATKKTRVRKSAKARTAHVDPAALTSTEPGANRSTA
jgi:predicted ATP-dependent serine protease